MSSPDYLKQLQELKSLHEAGVLSDAIYEKRTASLLDRLGLGVAPPSDSAGETRPDALVRVAAAAMWASGWPDSYNSLFFIVFTLCRGPRKWPLTERSEVLCDRHVSWLVGASPTLAPGGGEQVGEGKGARRKPVASQARR